MSSVAIKRLVTENVTFAFYFSSSKFLLQNTSKGRGNKKFRRIWKKLNCIVVWITSLLNSIRHVVPDSNSRYLQVSRDHILNLEKFLLQKIWCRLAMHLYLSLPFSSTSDGGWMQRGLMLSNRNDLCLEFSASPFSEDCHSCPTSMQVQCSSGVSSTELNRASLCIFTVSSYQWGLWFLCCCFLVCSWIQRNCTTSSSRRLFLVGWRISGHLGKS